jgi:hypothetical protein
MKVDSRFPYSLADSEGIWHLPFLFWAPRSDDAGRAQQVEEYRRGSMDPAAREKMELTMTGVLAAAAGSKNSGCFPKTAATAVILMPPFQG